ncbi:AAA domain-containing protein [Kribbella sp. NBC_01245]|uniref:AAA domain-containing protein n=1 Tax=Kribbella sp. NBC_01245 TaxID=2903578 RepID=UPI002E29B6E5|nr:AAA domain-containing protein [Kribbella sp. NBC_01245]
MRAAELVALAVDKGGLGSDALLAAVLPLFRQTAEIHERGLVAPLRGLDQLTLDEQSRLEFAPEQAIRPLLAPEELTAREGRRADAVEIIRERRLETDLERAGGSAQLLVAEPTPAAISSPVFVPGWQSWEHVVGHHDPLTDVFSLGQLLIALACGLDFDRTEDVARLIDAQGNLFRIGTPVHPVIAAVAVQMAEPDRHRRAQDLRSLIDRLEDYRDQPLDFDLAAITERETDRRAAVLTALRHRLFDLSRRNKLVQFRHTAQSLNLTEASVPLMLDVRTIRPEHLFTWSADLAGGKTYSLGKWVRYEEAPYAASSLDKLISTARRDRAEFGQDQLRLVPVFLRWHDLKNDPDTRLTSPLLLLKVELAKKRGVRDSYTLRVADPVAEVNPTLRHLLHELYGVELPEHIDLSEQTAMTDLHARLTAQFQASEPGLTLRYQDKPRIDLVRNRAMVRLRSYRRHQHGNIADEFGGRRYPYSYRQTDYQPLGVQIFRHQLAVQELPIGVLLGEPRTQSVSAPGPIETDTYTLDEGAGASPYAWDFDLCAVALANFNYRTLGLVRDYDELLANGQSCASFEQLFSDDPRPLSTQPPELPTAERHLVVPADGSQVAAVARARRGESFVIQGPPGTGKSQTITNMIADFVAQGRRVLFVCQKRAALDVVHARLAGRGLDELCTLIHDSQTDKKAFVHGLRDTYERWLAAGDDLDQLTIRRDEVITRINGLLHTVAQFEALLASGNKPALREVVERLAALRDQAWGDDLGLEDRGLVPTEGDWWPARGVVAELSRVLQAVDPSSEGVLARSLLARVQPTLWSAAGADLEIPARAARARDAWNPATERFADLPVRRLRELVSAAEVLAPLVERGRGQALEPGSPAARELAEARDDQQRQRTTAARCWHDARGWREPPPSAAEAQSAYKIAHHQEPRTFRFLNRDWRRIKSMVSSRFDRDATTEHASVTDALYLLTEAHHHGELARRSEEEAQRVWGSADLVALSDDLARIRQSDLADWHAELTGGLAEPLAQIAPALRHAEQLGAELLTAFDDLTLGELRALLDRLASPGIVPTLQALAAPLQALGACETTVQDAVRRLRGTPEQLEYAVSRLAWDRARAGAPELSSGRLDRVVGQLGLAYDELTDLNAAAVVARVRRRFHTELAHSELSATGMSSEDRDRKKAFSTGRRELEHEFGKVMRYKSIRELSSGASGSVVSLLRPVWLMSPSSVSDTLPLGTTFDVVVYDEASQIPIEEAVPALHRAPQVIVVGDQMQLPPTQYFRVSTAVRPDDDGDFGAEAEQVGVVLDEDSWLSISAQRLASTMLTWHYRSKSEALISFSNAAFYQGRLATVPDRLPAPTAPPWTVQGPAGEVGEIVDGLLAGSISTVRVADGVYQRRTNPAEARWIAAMVRELLGRSTGKSLGIVAFSEAQQGEIERALEELAQFDPEFGAAYEAELVRTRDDQDISLFVKNLENVQGDERDVILMSVCYAAGSDGRMLMNFGPINTAGGEKRLNVIFSRAREHMVIVSSIEPDAITNTYNDGANTLRRFLTYAEAVSRGDTAAASAGLGVRRAGTARETSAVVRQLADALREVGGIEVETDVGESVFRCDLALRRTGETGHRLAVLVDTPERVAADSLLERLGTHPRALTTGGWQVRHVLTTDWTQNPEAVVAGLQEVLARPTD